MNKNFLLLPLLLLLLLPFSSRAAVQFWDPDGATAGTSISGNWDLLTTNWTDVANSGVNATWSQGNDANFGVASDYTVTLTAPITVGNMTLTGTAGALTINGTSINGLTLGAPAIFNTGTRTSNISAPIGGGFSITKSGSGATGALVLSGANTYSGGTTLSVGSIGIGTDSLSSGGVITSGALGTGDLTFSTAATIFASGAPRVVHNSVILNGGLTNTGSQTLTFTNGTFKINAGNRNIFVSNTADLIIGSNLIDEGAPHSCIKLGTGRLILAGDNLSFLGPVTITTGTIALGGPAAMPTNNAVSVAVAGTLDLNGFDATVNRISGAGSVVLGTNTLTAGNNTTSSELTGVMSGNGGYVKVGTISQVLSGTNTFSGGILITEGSLYLPTNGLSGNAISLGAGANVITITNTGLIGANRGTAIITNDIVLKTLTAGLDPASSTFLTLSGQVTGPGGFLRTTKGSGVVAFTGSNTFTGGVQMDARALLFGHKNALGTGPLTLGNPTVPPVNTIDIASYNLDLVGPDAITNAVTLNQDFRFDGTLTGLGLELSGDVTANNGTRVITARGTGLAKMSGVISGSGGISKAGTNTLTLSGNNTYTGATTNLEGTLALTGSGSIAGSSDIALLANTTLDVSGRSDGTLIVGAAQTLRGDGAFNIVGNLASSGTIELKAFKSGLITTDTIQGMTHVTYGGTLSLVLTGDPLISGDALKLFDATSYSGSFTIVPATPASGLVWDTSTFITDGTLRVSSAGGPTFSVTERSGTNIVMSGTGGSPGGSFSVVSSTDIATSLADWPVVQTGTFGGSGEFSITNGIAPGDPQRFFSLRVP